MLGFFLRISGASFHYFTLFYVNVQLYYVILRYFSGIVHYFYNILQGLPLIVVSMISYLTEGARKPRKAKGP